MASRKYSKSHPGQSTQIISPPLRANFLGLDDRIMGANAAAQTSPDMTVVVTAFDYLGSNGQTWRTFAGGNSPVFAAPTVNPKIGLLTVDDTGTLAWTYGSEAAVPLKPNPPAGKVPVCFVHGRVGMTTINDDDTGTHGFILAQASALRATPSVASLVTPKGQCRLGVSGATLALVPWDGNLLTIDSIDYAIPDAGVTLGTGGLAANTTYYIYAYLAATVLTLEAVTTAPVTQAGTGLRIKGGPTTSRTLVGMARTTGATAWVDSPTSRLCLSHFNRRRRVLVNGFTTARSTTSTTVVEINSEIRLLFLNWGDDPLEVAYTDGITNSVAAGVVYTAIHLDTVVVARAAAYLNVVTAATPYSVALQSRADPPTEGFHTVTLYGLTNAGQTASWSGGSLTSVVFG